MTVTKTITTKRNTWAFDISIPPSGEPKMLRVYGDITDPVGLREAAHLALAEVSK